MFDIGWPELFVVAIVALVVIGPKDLPRVLQTVGKWVRKARSLAREFQSSVDDMVRESELEDLRKQMQQARSLNLKDQIEKTVDPKGEMRDSLTFGDLDLTDEEDEADRQAASKPAGTPAASAPAAVEHKPAVDMPLGRPVGDGEGAARAAAAAGSGPAPASPAPVPSAAETRPADIPAAEKRG